MKKALRIVALMMILIGLLALGSVALADGALVLPSAMKELADEAFMGVESVTEVVLPEGIESIGERAFAQSGLKRVNLPDSLTYIAPNAFEGLSLERVQVAEGSYAEEYCEDEGIAFDYKAILESEHPNITKSDKTWTWKGDEDTVWLEVTFSKKTSLAYAGADYSDTIWVLDSQGNEIGRYQKTELAGATLHLAGNCFSVRLKSSAYFSSYGFSVVKVVQHKTVGVALDIKTSVSPAVNRELSVKIIAYGVSNPTLIMNVAQDGKLIDECTIQDSYYKFTPTAEGLYTISAQLLDESGKTAYKTTVETSVTQIGFYFRKVDGETCAIVEPYDIPEEMEVVRLPDVICGSVVTQIADRAFRYFTRKVTGKLVFPKGLTTIGQYAFSECRLTGDLVLPEGVTTIGRSAFSYCDRLTGVVLPKGVTTIGDGAFYGCSNLTGDLVLPEGVTTVGNSAFVLCRFNHLVLPDSLQSIGDYAFCDVIGLSGELVMPKGLTTIGNHAFDNKLYRNHFSGDLVLPEGLISIGDYAFRSCDFTGNLVLPEGLISIGEYAFCWCDSLTGELILPESLTSIGRNAFERCNQLTGDLVIPAGVELGIAAFSDCSGFTRLVLPEGLTTISDGVFSGCSGFTGNLILPESLTAIGSYAFARCSGFTGELVLPEGITRIGSFSGCSGFTGLVLPESLTTIEKYAFSGCSGLIGKLALPEGLTSIGECAFSDCSGFTGELVLPNLNEIKWDAFRGCYGFTAIYMPPSVNGAKWSSSAFPKIPIHGEADSYAQTYAKKNGYPFIPTDFSATLTGSVLTETHTPLSGVTVSIYEDEALTKLAATVSTNSVGRWVWSNSSIGRQYFLVLEKEGYLFAGNGAKIHISQSHAYAPTMIASVDSDEQSSLELSAYQWSTDAQPSLKTIAISSPAGWYLVDAPAWISPYVQQNGAEAAPVQPMAVYDPSQELLLNVGENTTGQVRTGTVMLSNGKVQAAVAITQSADYARQGVIESLTTNTSYAAVKETVRINVRTSIMDGGIIVITDGNGADVAVIPFKNREFTYDFTPNTAGKYMIRAGVTVGTTIDYDIFGWDRCTDTADCELMVQEGEIDFGGMAPSAQYVGFLTKYEGFHSSRYKDGVNEDGDQMYSIGYGHNFNPKYVSIDEPISEAFAQELLRGDLAKFAKTVNDFAQKYGIVLNQHQFDALVDFCYNLGGGFLSSGHSLADELIAHPKTVSQISGQKISQLFALYHKELKENKLGIIRRRMDEAEMFLNGDYVRNERNAPYWLNCAQDGSNTIPEDWCPDFVNESHISVEAERIELPRQANTALSLLVESSDSWSAQSGAEWITVYSTTGKTGDRLKFGVSKNTGAGREGTIVLTCGSASTTLTIYQYGEVYDEFLFTATPEKNQYLAGEDINIALRASGGAGNYRYEYVLSKLDGNRYVPCGKKGSIYAQPSSAMISLGGMVAGCYRAEISGRDIDGNPNARSTYFTVVQGEMAIENPLTSGNVVNYEEPLNIQWSEAALADEYVIRIRDLTTNRLLVGTEDGDGRHLDKKVQTFSLGSRTLGTLRNHVLRIWIGAYKKDYLVGQAQTVLTIGPVKAVEITSPQDVKLDSGSLTVSWKPFNDGVNPTAFYQLRVRDVRTDKLMVDTTLLPGDALEYALSGENAIADGHSYRVWVGAFTKDGGRIGQKEVNFYCQTVFRHEFPRTREAAQALVELPAPKNSNQGNSPMPVRRGTIRFVSQLPDNSYFCMEYWKNSTFNLTIIEDGSQYKSRSMCTRAVYCMALSYLGVDVTPIEVSMIANSHDVDEPYVNITETLIGVSQADRVSLDDMVERYAKDPNYSPVYLHFKHTHKNGYYGPHCILIIGKESEDTYFAVDPANNGKIIKLTIRGNKIEACEDYQWYAQGAITNRYQWKLDAASGEAPLTKDVHVKGEF